MKFYCISSAQDDKPDNVKLLRDASEQIGKIDFDVILESSDLSHLPNAKPYILYRCVSKHIAPLSIEIEKKMLGPNAITFYSSWKRGFFTMPESYQIHEKFGLPIAPTQWPLSGDEKDLLKKVGQLGGFPIILKKGNSSRGAGVLLCRSADELISRIPVIHSEPGSFILRKYIDVGTPPYSYRAIIIGKTCVLIYKNQSTNKDEYRSNVNQGSRTRTIVEMSSTIQSDLIRSVEVLGLELGAVDFLIDKAGKLNILEVNFPFNFSPIVKDMGTDIHVQMVEHLFSKRK